jgi:hypothetical protein
MPQRQFYVPILKWKRGEYSGVAELEDDARARLLPLFEVQRLPWDFDQERPKKPLKEHLESFVKQAKKAWGTANAFVDLAEVDPSSRVGKLHPVDVVFASSLREKLNLIPVAGLDRDTAYNDAVARAVASGTKRACLRLRRKDLFDDDVEARVRDLLRSLRLPVAQADLICDLKDIDDGNLLASVLPAAVEPTLALGNWKTFTVAGCAFPESVAAIPVDSDGDFERRDFALWEALLESSELERKPGFGDYGVVHWSSRVDDVNPAVLPIYANIRYTLDDRWYVVRGDLLRSRRGREGRGYGQYKDLAAQVVAHAEYKGADFSAGDGHLARCAVATEKFGSPEYWLRAGTNHHVTHVHEQVVATLAAS